MTLREGPTSGAPGETTLAVPGADHAAPRTLARLRAGADETRVVCFGDSITGIYYHTGGYRAWPELFALALGDAFPKAGLQVVNAGISGNTAAAGLGRLERDVLAHKPHLVVVMYGMNDISYGTVEPAVDAERKSQFRADLEQIIVRCRQAGAEVLLMTPNSVYPDAAPQRPPKRLEEFAVIVGETAKAAGVGVIDAFGEWERIRQEDPRRWRLLMSETIHPCFNGHLLFAELAASAVGGESVSLSGLHPYRPCLAHTATALRAGQKIVVVAADSIADGVQSALLGAVPDAGIDLVRWPVHGRSLAAMQAWAERIRDLEGTALVVGTFPPETEIGADEEAFVRQANWVIDYALTYVRRAWDVVFVDPNVLRADLTPAQVEAHALLRDAVEGHDLVWLDRPQGSKDSAAEILAAGLGAELGQVC
jgi:lysophospholipase L1-like esterase